MNMMMMMMMMITIHFRTVQMHVRRNVSNQVETSKWTKLDKLITVRCGVVNSRSTVATMLRPFKQLTRAIVHDFGHYRTGYSVTGCTVNLICISDK